MGIGRGVGEARVLVVGAGGIGCELLKNLVLSGFTTIHIVDVDVIELSNLNRQFLFRREHIGQSKAKVAAEAVTKLNPNVTISPHFANIKDATLFPLNFFRSFDLVLNALDNLEARRYVNGMCLAAQVPLVESGTAGYLGQTSVIQRGGECFECTPKEVPKTFAVCTIRTTPSAPIHCVVWAKEVLLANLFGPGLAEDEGVEGTNGIEAPTHTIEGKEVDEAMVALWKGESESFDKLKKGMMTMAVAMGAEDGDKGDGDKEDGGKEDYPQAILDKVFREDVEKLLALEGLWEARTRPTPLDTFLAMGLVKDDDRLFSSLATLLLFTTWRYGKANIVSGESGEGWYRLHLKRWRRCE